MAGKGSSSPDPAIPGSDPVDTANLLVTELFPDPASPLTDAADEFIEIYNPNPNPTPIDLAGYSIKTGATLSTKHVLASAVVQPDSYVALKSATTKIALANAGSSVALFSPTGAQIGATITYPQAKTGASWTWDGEGWSWSTTPTPGAANVISAPEPATAAAAKTGSSTTAKSSSAKTSTSKPKAATTAPKATKIPAATKTGAGSSPFVAGATSSGGHWLLFILAALTIGYIIYEFRYDIRNYYYKLRGYPVGRPAPVSVGVGRGSDRTNERPRRG